MGRILFTYKKLKCVISAILQFKQEEEPEVINADYCTAPSWNTAYLSAGLMYHPTYYPNYSLNEADRVTKAFTSYPQYNEIKGFMAYLPYRSVWVDSDCDGTKDSLAFGSQVTIGKSISFDTDRTVTVGIFGDNQFAVAYDGQTIVSVPYLGLTVHTPFTYLHLFEINVTAGDHYFSFTGTGDGSVNDSLGVIMWDAPVSYIMNDSNPPSLSELNQIQLYSSEESLSQSIDIVICPDGYSYDNEVNKCIKIEPEVGCANCGTIVKVTPILQCAPAGTIGAWVLDYGDGTSETGSGTIPSTFEHSYYYSGTYTVTFSAYVNDTLFVAENEVCINGCDCYGALYNWYAVSDARNIANVGWHVPTNIELYDIAQYLDPAGNGDANVAGTKMKDFGVWTIAPATNTSGFSARPTGKRDSSGNFTNAGIYTYVWCSNDFFGTNVAYRGYLVNNSETFQISDGTGGSWISAKAEGNTVRLIKDSTTLSHGEYGTYTGNDGKVYKTICIGTKEVLIESLEETQYRNGDYITLIGDNNTWASTTKGAMCYYANDVVNACKEVPAISTACTTYDPYLEGVAWVVTIGTNYSFANSISYQFAQTITETGYLCKATLNFFSSFVGAPDFNIRAILYEGSIVGESYIPTNNIIAQSTNVVAANTAIGAKDFNFDRPYLDGNIATIAFVYENIVTHNASNYVRVFDTSGNEYDGGNRLTASYSSGNWLNSSDELSMSITLVSNLNTTCP